MATNDYQMALLLQRQFQHEANIDNPTHNLVYKPKKSVNSSNSLTDPSWELIDPTPDIYTLFIAFNQRYFWDKLVSVCVDWSKRMTTCAGVCSYQGRGGLCKITLSEPLLKLRPRKDLIETLLHEMIHAYLFVTCNNRDRDGHGPEFHKHMYRINGEAGTNITVYHDFHDEVRLYQQHWWRCNGPCQQRKPYFGMVRRATNRAPGPNDLWWSKHQESCGGQYVKVQEPVKPEKKKPQKENKPTTNSNNDIRKFLPVLKETNATPSSITSTQTNINGFKDLTSVKPKNALANSSSTIVITQKTSKTDQQVKTDKPSEVEAFSGKGRTLSTPSCSNADYSVVRNHWTNKFPTKRAVSASEPPKRFKPDEVIELVSETVACPVCLKEYPAEKVNEHLDECLSGAETKTPEKKCPICDFNVAKEIFDGHVQRCVEGVFKDSNDDDFSQNKVELISCLVCNKEINKSDLDSHLDECLTDGVFNNSCKSQEIKEDTKTDDFDKMYNCPVCFQLLSIQDMSVHLDKCLSATDETSKQSFNDFFDDVF